ncbi:hypothetical protein VKT23_012737 [Stygiomarasmius scandens]|uniref:Uncharacterized protein n=1 Tax=Marasmiellus scandens TaxID=2682957 RepID=A0ABR1J5S1_9AGAR
MSNVPDTSPSFGLRNVFSYIVKKPGDRRNWRHLAVQRDALKTEATIAAFLSGVQQSVFSLASNSTSTPTIALTAAKTLALIGLILDIIAAFLAHLSSTLLDARITQVREHLDTIEKMPVQHLDTLEINIRSYHSPKFTGDPLRNFVLDTLYWKPLKAEVEKTIARSRGKSTAEKAKQGATSSHSGEPHQLDEHNTYQLCYGIGNIGCMGDAAGTALLFGIIALISSAVCHAAATQPVEVWAPTVATCGCVIALPAINMFLKLFDIREWPFFRY